MDPGLAPGIAIQAAVRRRLVGIHDDVDGTGGIVARQEMLDSQLRMPGLERLRNASSDTCCACGLVRYRS